MQDGWQCFDSLQRNCLFHSSVFSSLQSVVHHVKSRDVVSLKENVTLSVKLKLIGLLEVSHVTVLFELKDLLNVCMSLNSG
jgi:hypothetical protein